MGFGVKFNWVLQIDPKSSLEKESIHGFSKDGNRIFPIKTPIDLINSNREALAKISILWFKNIEKETTGEFKVLKVYTGEEKRILTQYWIENQ